LASASKERPVARVRSAAGVVAAAALLLGACGRSTDVLPTTGTGGTTMPVTTFPAGSPADYTRYSVPGPYKAGTVQYLVHGDRVQVWYPVAPAAVPSGARPYTYHLRSWLPPAVQKIIPASLDDTVTEDAYANLPVAAGTFPVVLFSHGVGGYPEQSSFLTAHLATWGFVVVAPDQTRRDLTAVILQKKHSGGNTVDDARTRAKDVSQMTGALAFVEYQSAAAATLLSGHVNGNEVGTLGHSSGGYTAIATAEADASIKTAVALAGDAIKPPTRSLPILLMSGSFDKLVPTAGVQRGYDQLLSPKAFVIVNRAGHNVFDDVCTIARREGGVAAAARSLKLPVPPGLLRLALDGCRAPDIYPPKAFGLIDQSVTAELLYGLGVNKTPIGLGPGIENAFPGVTAIYQGNPPTAG
jgi:dienelactone hydrolase